MSHKLRISILGPLAVEQNGQLLPETAWRSRQERRLLAILLARRGRRTTSEQLAALLWPASDSAAATLRATMSGLRRIIEPDAERRVSSRYILTTPGAYLWNPDGGAWIDAEEFLALTHAAGEQRAISLPRRHASNQTSADDLERALSLYRGELFEDEPDAPWALAERRRLHERFLWAAQALVELRLEHGEVDSAVTAAQQALRSAPLAEPIVRGLMHALLLAGDAAGALEHYERYRQSLDEALGGLPSPQTQTLHRAILRGDSSAAGRVEVRLRHPDYAVRRNHHTSPANAVPVVGRERELAALQTWLDEAARRRGGIVALVGEAGIGKTRLASETLREAAARGMQPLMLRCMLLEREHPFAPLGAALGPLVRAAPDAFLRRLPPSALAQAAELLPALRDRLPDLPQLPALPAAEHRNRLAGALADLAFALARSTPLVVVCDDAQWADEATLALLNRLAQGAARAAVLIVLAYRADELPDSPMLHALLRTLGRQMLLRPLLLDRLDQAAATQVIAAIGGVSLDQAARLAPRLTERSSGNPLFLTVMVQALMEQHGAASLTPVLARLENKQWVLPDLSGVQPIRDLVLGRIERLPPAARDLAEQVAILGRSTSLDLIEALLGHTSLEAARVLLERQIFAEKRDGRIGFGHELVRAIIAAALVSPRRRTLHRRAAEALIELHGERLDDAAEIAHHLAHAGRDAEPQLLRFATLAGDHARRAFAYRAAVSHYEAALAVGERRSAGQNALVRRAFAGRLLAAEALLDWDSIVTTSGRHDAWASRIGVVAPLISPGRLALLRALMGDLAGAAQRIREQPSLAENAAPALAEMWRRTALILLPDDLPVEQPQYVDGTAWPVPSFAALAPLPGSPTHDLPELLESEEAGLVLFQLGWAAATQGVLPDAEACLLRAFALAAECQQPALATLAALQLAHCAALAGANAEREQWLLCSLEKARAAPEAAWASIWPSIHCGYLWLLDDRLEEAQAQFEMLATQLAGLPAFDAHRASIHIGLGLAALAGGERARAAELLAPALAQPPNTYGFVYVAGLLGMARLAAAEHGAVAARVWLRKALDYSVRRSLLPEYVRTAIEIARIERDYGDPALALDLLREAVAHASKAGLVPMAEAATALLGRLSA